jgi:TRAP-type C4-dicarboxylate transport system permease small subunit
MLRVLKTVNRAIQVVENWFAIVLMGGSALITVAQVVTRYGFNHPLTWPEELCTLLLVWMTFVGASLLLKKEAHIEIDFFAKLLPLPAQKVIALLNIVLMFGFLAVAAWGAWKLQFFQSRHYSVALGIPKNFFSMPVLIFSVSMCVYLLLAFTRRLIEFALPQAQPVIEAEPELRPQG